ncbi:MAG: hypothetical protein VST69_07225, partial [Nitrospirota bacterium]|nr:hypothetical protein [Nitrospirota bacterium]
EKQSHLTQESASNLRRAYLFLRNLENKLQMLNDHQTHLLPKSQNEMGTLAIRLAYSESEHGKPETQLEADYTFHTKKVHEAYTQLFKEQAKH